MKHILRWLSVFALGGCMHAPIISNPGEAPGDPATGDVTAISEHLAGKTTAYVIFLHGVGDHCPGYALDDNFGWLNKDIIPLIGFKTNGTTTSVPVEIPDSDFMPNHPTDSASKVTYISRDFTYATSGPNSHDVTVHAIEITWSQLTQWVKTNQLDYDLAEPFDKPPSETPSCPYLPTATYKKPPPRQAINRLVKESILDRSLVDAVLYAGAYGRVMRRGVAEAVCLALGGTKNDPGKLCHWPVLPSGPARRQTAYFFVTHSLGSRLVYDTLLGLTGTDVTATAATFASDEVTSATPFVDHLMIHTAAFYMMANQLPLLGLAYEDGTHSSTDGPVPYELVLQNSPIVDIANAPQLSGATPVESVAKTSARPSVNAFAARRMRSARDKGEDVRKLKVVAFSDPNDLLSWGIPKWYQRPKDGSTPAVDFTNVYLQNSAHWLGFIESPAPAHVGYFVNPDVWRVIQCGASSGKVIPCR